MSTSRTRPAPARSTTSIRYTMWSVFRLDERRARRRGPTGRPRRPRSRSCSTKLAADDVVVRGMYDVAGLRADADVMVWWHADDLRAAAGGLPPASGARRSVAGSRRSGRRWRCTGRRSSTRATSRRSSPRRSRSAHVCVYPFVRSYEWYLLEDAERRRLLAEHGQMARDYPDVRANTVAELRARRLRVDPGLRGRRAGPHRRPDASPARLRDPAPRARGGAVLHRRPHGRGRPGGPAALSRPPGRRGKGERDRRRRVPGPVTGVSSCGGPGTAAGCQGSPRVATPDEPTGVPAVSRGNQQPSRALPRRGRRRARG